MNDLAVQHSRALVFRSTRADGLTLIEVIVTISIVSVLMFVFLPAVQSVRRAARGVLCAANLKSATAEFQLFVDEASSAEKSSHGLADRTFYLGDFLDSLYGLDEYWNPADGSTARVSESNPLLCPASSVELTKNRGFPCSRQALSPLEGISIAANMRLFRAPVTIKGKSLLAPQASTRLSARIWNHPYAPLLLDVDARSALQKGVDPFYIAPPIPGSNDPYASGRYWSPASRHNKKALVGFVGGHVLGSAQPENERWDWIHQGEVGR